MTETAPAPPLQAVSVPVVVGGVRWLADNAASISVTTSLEYSIAEMQGLYNLQKQPCQMLLQPEGLATVESPAPEPKKKKAATPSQELRMLLEAIWEETPELSPTATDKESYYRARMQQHIDRARLELEQIRQQK